MPLRDARAEYVEAEDEDRFFDTAEEFVAFLKDTLIPDLMASGYTATAKDFREAIHWIMVGKGKKES